MTDRESMRASWAVAGYWDRAVRLSRARAAIGYPNRTAVREIDGVPHLIDLDSDRRAPL